MAPSHGLKCAATGCRLKPEEAAQAVAGNGLGQARERRRPTISRQHANRGVGFIVDRILIVKEKRPALGAAKANG